MNTIIINLPRSKKRLDFQKIQLRNLDISFEVLTAVDVNDLKQSDIEKKTLGWERPLRNVELACFMSHKKAWEKVLKSELPTLILEDDALLSLHVGSLLKNLKREIGYDLITLEVRGRKKIVSKSETLSTNKFFNLFQLYQDRTGAAAYILWPSGAKKLLQKAINSPPGLADAFISSCYSLMALQVEPAAAIQLDQCTHYNINCSYIPESEISTQQKPSYKNLSFFYYFLFKFRRLTSQLKMGIRHLSVVSIGHKRHINIESSYFSNE